MNPAGAGAVEVFVFKDGRFLGSRCYSQSVITVGRSRAATLKLIDPSVSEQHAVINCDGTNVVVSDHGSHNGVFVNGKPVNTRNISSFDEIAIGPFRLKVSLLGGQEEEDPGFGAEAGDEAEAATVVRRVDMPEFDQGRGPDPHAAAMEEATLPRIMRPVQGQSGFDQEQTHAFDGPRGLSARAAPRFSAADALQPAHLPSLDPVVYEEIPTKADVPARMPRSAGGGSFEDFSRPPEEPAPAHRPAPARQPVSESAAHVAATRRVLAVEQPLQQQEQEELDDEQDVHEPEQEAPNWDATSAPDDDDDDDDDDEPFVEPFSLLENVVREKFKSKIETVGYATVEVIHYHGSQIHDLLRADPGKTIHIDLDRFRLVKDEASGRASLFFKPDFKGTLVTKGKARSLKAFMNERFAVRGKGDTFAVTLNEGDYAQVIRGSSGYLVRFVRPPTLPKSGKQALKPNWVNLQIFVASAVFHFLILVMLGFVAPAADLTVTTDAERFAKVAVKDLKLEKPKEEPKVEQPKEEPVKPQPTKDAPKVTKKIKKLGPPRPVSEVQRKKIQKKQVANVLSALENLKPSAGPGRSDLKSLVSNIAAVRVPGGTSSGFKVAGVIGKIPGGGVRLAGGLGGGGKDTRVGSQLLSGAGAKIGNVAALAGTGTRVRGRVRKAPTRAIQATGGILDRGAIQKVVNSHMAEIQRCYEVQLLKSPGLSGKIVFDWVIATSGLVSSARQVSSSMQSPAVATCILSQIRTWRFPQPVGGSVQVRYPFVFRVQGF